MTLCKSDTAERIARSWRPYSGVTMKHITFASMIIVLACSASVYADTVEVPWAKVCEASHGKSLVVTTTNGETLEGFCTSINVDEIGLTKDQRLVKVAKSATCAASRASRQESSVCRAVERSGARIAGRSRFPIFFALRRWEWSQFFWTLAWGAVASPFCLLADLGDRLAGENEIKVK